jgi:integrase
MARRRSNLYQRDSGRWTAYLRLNGEQTQKTFNTRDEAVLWLTRMEQKRVMNDEVILPKKITFGDFAEEWLRDYAHPPKIAIRTAEGYEMSLRNHLIPYFGRMYLAQITRKSIEQFISDWETQGPHFTERARLVRERAAERARTRGVRSFGRSLGHSPGTIRNAMVPFKEMLGYAVNVSGYIEINPATRIRVSGDEYKDQETIQVLSGSEVERLLAAAPDDYRTLFLTAVSTGVRLGEQRALRWKDVGWDERRLHVRRSVTKTGIFQHTKTKKTRAIPLSQSLMHALREHKMRSRFKDDEDLIFPNSLGAPMDGHNMVNRQFRPTLKKAGLPTIRWHDLRHTFATLLLQKGVPVTVVSKTLGHASAKMTLDTYSHVIAEDLDDAADAMEAVLLGADAKAVEQA